MGAAMVDDQSFEIYRQQIMLMTHMVAARRRSEVVEDRAVSLEAACKCAVSSLKRDLDALVEMERMFALSDSERPSGSAPSRPDHTLPLTAA